MVVRKWVMVAAVGGLVLCGCKKQQVKGGLEPIPQETVMSAPVTPEPSQPAMEPVVPEPVAPPARGKIYVVQKGDTLFNIARKCYGAERKWRDIWEANKAQIPDPNKLRVGQELILP